jgi:UDP-glucose:(heptosyl)LPS alpha-1,3-glucosyltransferase
MKIALIHPEYTPFGGAARQTTLIMKELLQQGHEIHLFARSWELPESWMEQVTIHEINVPNKPSILRFVAFAYLVKRRLKNESFDVVHSFAKTVSQDVVSAGGGCAREWLRWKKKIFGSALRRAIPFDSFSIKSHVDVLMEQQGYLKTPVIIAVSKRVKDEILKNYDINPERINVVYYGVDLGRFNPGNVSLYRNEFRASYGISEDEILLLFLGSGFTRKGLRSLIEALGILAHDQWKERRFRLVVVGQGRRHKYQQLAEHLGVSEKVIFVGPHQHPEQVCAAADLSVLPSYYEPFGCVHLEAMATGIPSVASRISGASEILDRRSAGAIVEDPLCPEELAAKISPFADDSIRYRAGIEARKVAEEHSVTDKVRQTIELYEKWLG